MPDKRQPMLRFVKLDKIEAGEGFFIRKFQLHNNSRHNRLLGVQTHRDDLDRGKQHFVRNRQLVWSRHSPLSRAPIRFANIAQMRAAA